MLELPTPSLVIDQPTLERNVRRMAEYTRSHNLALRPHTKTHKSLRLAKLQLDAGASGLTVAKVGEAEIFAKTRADLLLAYPTVDPHRCTKVAELARQHKVRVALDSELAAQRLSSAAQAAGSHVTVLVDLDVGMHRTGVASPADALNLAQAIEKLPHIKVAGLFFYPGQIPGQSTTKLEQLRAVDALLEETLALWKQSGIEASIVSGGSTPTALDSHLIKNQNEIRPGTYVFNDMNSVRGGVVTLEDCAAFIVCTVISTAVAGQVVLDGGSKTFTSDRCGPAPDSGYGFIVEYPDAMIGKLTEEHAQVDISNCSKVPALGEHVRVIPNHICPCVNLQDQVWLRRLDGELEPLVVDARGKLQ